MTVQDTASTKRELGNVQYGAYYQREIPGPDPVLQEAGPGTPMGEYLRRFWQPVCLSEQLTDLPHAIRIMSEDLVAFRDRSGQIGVLNRYCSHRGTSLEYGRISENGIRCCYHGWHYDVDGKVLDIPGEPAGSRLKDSFCHGAYPAFEYHGLVFAYMGPPELKPHFQMYDLLEVPGAEYAAFALPFDGNWMNANENGMDPVHAVFLHRRYSGDFDESFGVMPEHLTWQLTGDGEGMMYMMIRRVDDEWLWARSLHKIFPNQRSTPSVFELDRPVYAKRAYHIRIGVPVDDDSHIWFGWRVHGKGFEGGDPSLNGWGTCCMGGQSGSSTYEQSQRTPGDLEAQGSQWGGTSRYELEHLGTSDGGVALLRRGLRNILDGSVPSAWPEPAEGNEKPKSKKVYSQDNMLRIKRLSDSDQDREMMGELGTEIIETVIDADRLDGETRQQHLVSRIKEIEVAFQKKYN